MDQLVRWANDLGRRPGKRLRPRSVVPAVLVGVAIGLVGMPAAAGTKAASEPPSAAETRTNAMIAKLKLKGNGHRQDSFSLVVQAVGRLLGRNVSYERVLALSSNGFAPAYRPQENCTAWWGWTGPRSW